MKIHHIYLRPLGPLPEVNFRPGPLTVIYDGNEAGKTALVDGLVQLLFGKSAFPGSDRFGEAAGKIQIEHQGAPHTLSGKQSVTKLLGWQQSRSQFGRFFCVRAGELDLAARSETFPQLMDALISVLGELDVSPQRVIKSVQEAACLTSSGKWSDEQSHGRASQIQETTKRLRQLNDALASALTLQEKEKKTAETLQELSKLDQQIQQLENLLVQLEQQRAAQRYHQAHSYYHQWQTLQKEIQQDYARYRLQDLQEWQNWEQQLKSKQEAFQKAKDHQARLAQEQKNLTEQLADRRTELQLQKHEWERANENKQTLEDHLRAERRKLSEQVTFLTAELTKYRQAELSVRQREVWARLMPWTAGAAILLCAACLAVAMLKSLFWGAIGLGIFLVLALFAVWWAYRWRLQAEAVHQQEAALREQAAQAGLPWKGVEQFGETLRHWQEEKEKQLEEKRQMAEKRYQQCAEEVARLETNVQYLTSRLEELNHDLALAEQHRAQLEQQIEALQADIQQIRQRCGLPERADLEQKVHQRQALEAKQAELKASLSTLTERDDAKGWLAWLDQTSQNLPPPWKETATGLPSLEEIEKQLDQLRYQRSRMQQERQGLNQEAEQLRKTCDELRAKLHPLGVRDAVQVYLAMEDAQQKLKEWVKQRLAALLAIHVLHELQQSYVSALQEPLDEASTIFQQITQRYQGLRYDRSGGRFYAWEQNGQEFDEEKLSSGARAQLLFAVRLALVQKLCSQEPGFLILDDPFLTYASDRKERAVAYLANLVQQGWQVVYLTVDPATRDLFCQKKPDSQVLSIADLSRPVQISQSL